MQFSAQNKTETWRRKALKLQLYKHLFVKQLQNKTIKGTHILQVTTGTEKVKYGGELS